MSKELTDGLGLAEVVVESDVLLKAQKLGLDQVQVGRNFGENSRLSVLLNYSLRNEGGHPVVDSIEVIKADLTLFHGFIKLLNLLGKQLKALDQTI